MMKHCLWSQENGQFRTGTVLELKAFGNGRMVCPQDKDALPRITSSAFLVILSLPHRDVVVTSFVVVTPCQGGSPVVRQVILT